MDINSKLTSLSVEAELTRRPKPKQLPQRAPTSFAERRAAIKAREDMQDLSYIAPDTSLHDTTISSEHEANTTKRSSIMAESLDRLPPGGPSTRPRKMPSRPELTKQRSHFFHEAFSSGRDGGREVAIRDAVRGQALIMADLKTNVILESEYNMLTAMSAELAERYNRPVTSIVVTMQHGGCLSFAGNFEPAYVLEIHAPAVELQPITNKRNAALLMNHIGGILGVPSSRAYIRFVPTPDENVATAGRTLAAILDEAVAKGMEELRGLGLGSLRTSKKGSKHQKNSSSLKMPRLRESSSSASVGPDVSIPGPAIRPGYRTPMPERKAKRTKSFMALLFGKTEYDAKNGDDEEERRRLSSTS